MSFPPPPLPLPPTDAANKHIRYCIPMSHSNRLQEVVVEVDWVAQGGLRSFRARTTAAKPPAQHSAGKPVPPSRGKPWTPHTTLTWQVDVPHAAILLKLVAHILSPAAAGVRWDSRFPLPCVQSGHRTCIKTFSHFIMQFKRAIPCVPCIQGQVAHEQGDAVLTAPVATTPGRGTVPGHHSLGNVWLWKNECDANVLIRGHGGEVLFRLSRGSAQGRGPLMAGAPGHAGASFGAGTAISFARPRTLGPSARQLCPAPTSSMPPRAELS